MIEPPIRLFHNIEQELVLASISLASVRDERIIEILRQPLDWNRLIQTAVQQGVYPLVYQRLKSAAEKQISVEKVGLLNHWYEAITQTNYRLAWKLIQLANLLADKGIDFVVLKGPVYALQAFGDLAFRQFADLDILIHIDDFSSVYALLIQSGYSPAFKLGPKQIKFELRTENHFTFVRQGDEIEVHWGILPKGNLFPIPSGQMWQGLTSVTVFDSEMRALSPENTLLFTCIHGAKHGWRQFKWIVDLAMLCQSYPDLNWQAFVNRAKAQGFFRQVCLGLLLAEELVGAAVPAIISDQVHTEQTAKSLASEVQSRLFAESNKPGVFSDYGFNLRSRERWRERMYYLFDMVFVPKEIDWRTFPLPEFLYPLYCLFRPVRLIFIVTRAAFKELFRRILFEK